jgi:hypothetical protein
MNEECLEHAQAESAGVRTPFSLVRERETEREKEEGREREGERERMQYTQIMTIR